jgi:outer membrane protein OmpA-like peptidoglycan-associated protein
MHRQLLALTTLALSSTFAAQAQNAPPPGKNVPLYRVTVIERTVKAINYQYRSGPTPIDFKGTVLLPEAKGQAIVESKAGRTEIDAKLERLRPPARFGHEYLTYVMWAVTPQGHAKNLGEVMPGHSDKASLHITTDLPAFGLIVTAEPYAAVRQPSDVVVMENEIRPETLGQIEPINAKYELLPRGHYTYNVPADMVAAEGNGAKVPMDQYESLVQVYQAQNAVQIAKAAGADEYAADTFHKAEVELANAQQLRASKADRSKVVMAAREAAETAEDARTIALKHKDDAEIAAAKEKASQAESRRLSAEAEVQRLRAQASADRAQLDQERMARQQAETQSAAAQTAAPAPPPVTVTVPPPPQNDSQQRMAIRTGLFTQLSSSGLRTVDSPRGLVVTVGSREFESGMPNLARIAAIVNAHPGLTVEVSGHSDSTGAESERTWRQRADMVRDMLLRNGVPSQAISTRYDGIERPVASNASPSGRDQNRRVEITIYGDPIGNQPHWDRSYSVAPRQ